MSAGHIPIASVRAVLATTALVALGGCTTLGGNVKGSFSCVAPDGICAPSSSIDDRALAMIAGETGVSGAVPARPIVDLQAPARPLRIAVPGPRVPVGEGDPRRTQERVLRIVFQPYIDGYGRLHEASAVHAVVESGAWQQELLVSSKSIPGLSAGAGPFASSSLAEAVDRLDGAGAEVSAIDPNLPDPAVVAAARARAPMVDPITAIKDDVAARLAPQASPPRRVISQAAASPIERTNSPNAGAAAVTTKSATEAVTRVKATAEYQARARDAQDGARDAGRVGASPVTKPTTKPPVRAAGFPGAVTEDN